MSSGLAVVTGAASGIGLGIARQAARRGMDVVLADIDADRLAAARDEVDELGAGKAWARRVDVTDWDSMAGLATWVGEHAGEVRLLVNNAGVELHGLLWQIPPDRWQRLMDINVTGVFHGIRAFLPAMVRSPRSSRVVNVSSTGGLGARGLMAPYIASKHAVLALTESLELELRAHAPQVSTSAFLPSSVRSAIFESAANTGDDGPGEAQRRAMQARNVRDSLSADAAAELLFAGLDAGLLWIHTDPERSLRRVRERAHAILTGIPVEPPVEPAPVL